VLERLDVLYHKFYREGLYVRADIIFEVIELIAGRPFRLPSRAGQARYLSCLTSCSHSPPLGVSATSVGKAGGTKASFALGRDVISLKISGRGSI
jgi:hypothetical protein